MINWRMASDIYTKIDADIISDVLSTLERKGERYRHRDGTVHIFGLGVWVSKHLDLVERFIMACTRLRSSYGKKIREIERLKKDLQKTAGTTEIVDLGEQHDLRLWSSSGFRGIMIPKEHAKRLVIAINEATEQYRQHGFAEGSNILRRLAIGDMSITNFENEVNKNS